VRIGERHLVSTASFKRQPLSFLAHAALVTQPVRTLENSRAQLGLVIEKESFDGPNNQQRN
jgi:hypothetical protein